MLGGLDYGSGKLWLVKAASGMRPFSCPAFSIRFLVWRAGKIGFDECWRHHPGRGRANESLTSKLETRVTEYENDCDRTFTAPD
jgi:hypothetical protein